LGGVAVFVGGVGVAAFGTGAGFVFAVVVGLIFGGAFDGGTGAGETTGAGEGSTTPTARSPAGAAIN
jgi:hypothetical protein